VGTRKATLIVDKVTDLKDTLPDIGKFELVVNPTVAAGEIAVEIFASVEIGQGLRWLDRGGRQRFQPP